MPRVPPDSGRENLDESTQTVNREPSELHSDAWCFLVRFWPLILFLGYLTFTVIVFAFGPIDYPISNPWATYGFLAAAHTALLVGYVLMPFRKPRARPAPGDEWMFSVSHLIVVSALLNIAVLIPSTLFMTGGSFDVIEALREPGMAYRRAYRASINSTNPFSYAAMLVAPLLVLVVPLTLYYWRRLSIPVRCLGVSAIAVILASGVMLGRNKAAADLVLLGLVFLLAHVFRRKRPPSMRRCAMSLMVAVTISALFFALFSTAIANRGRRVREGYVASIDDYLDYDNALLSPFPDAMKPGVGQLCNYLTQGYYGLSLALRIDFVWTYGLGNSFFLHEVEERFVGSEYARENAYPARIEEQFDYLMMQRWHSIYPWLASDLTFAGALAFVAVIGMLLALTWSETLTAVNPFSVAMFANLCLMLFYFNANNQVLAFPVQFSGTVGILFLWLITRWRLRRGPSVAALRWLSRKNNERTR